MSTTYHSPAVEALKALIEKEESLRNGPLPEHKAHKSQHDATLEEIASLLEDCLQITDPDAASVSAKAKDLVREEIRSTLDRIYTELMTDRSLLAEPGEESDREPIDTLNGGTRHMALIGRDGIAHTTCGKNIVFYFQARHHNGAMTSYWYDDGTRWVKPCRHCLPDDYRVYKEAQR